MKINIFTILFIIISFHQLHSQCGVPDISIWENTWQSCEPAPNPNLARGTGHWVHYDFGAIYTLTKTHIWNTNEPNKTNMGFRNIIVDYSEDGVSWTELGVYELLPGTAQAVYGGEEGFDFEGKQAQYVIITATSNWGHPDCYGLAEVKFNLSPGTLPSTVPCDDPPCDEACDPIENASAMVFNAWEALLLWNETDQAENYRIRVREVGGNWEEYTMEEAEIFLENLTPETEYEFQIQIYCEEEWTDYSDSFYFSTIEEQEECDQPVTSNYFVADIDYVLISWNEVPDALLYELRYREVDSAEPWVIIETEETVVELETLEEGKEYEYQIRVLCPDDWTTFSDSYLLETGLLMDDITAVDTASILSSSFQLYPNPAQSQVHLVYRSSQGGEAVLELTDVTGKVNRSIPLQVNPGENQYNLSLNNVTTGIYFVTIKRTDGIPSMTKRLAVIGF